jgi:hypothetical protein
VIRVAAVLLFAVLGGCKQPEATAPAQDAAVIVPPAESRPPHIQRAVKWLPESPRYQQAREDVFRRGTDFESRLDFGREQLSRKGLYRVTLVPGDVDAQGFSDWTMRVVSTDGAPVSAATINVRGGMPEHGHGLPTQPRAVALDTPGEYRVEGLQFSMPGWWELSFYIASERRDDTVTFNLQNG